MQQNFLCPRCWRENSGQSAQCRHCGAMLGTLGTTGLTCPAPGCGWPRSFTDRYCGNCGKPLPAICPNCGNILKQDSRYCPRCSYFCGGGRRGLI